jgi:hypothetical protein
MTSLVVLVRTYLRLYRLATLANPEAARPLSDIVKRVYGLIHITPRWTLLMGQVLALPLAWSDPQNTDSEVTNWTGFHFVRS